MACGFSVGQGHKRGTGYECVEQQGIRSAVSGRPINGGRIKKGANGGAIWVRSKIARSRKANGSPVAFVL